MLGKFSNLSRYKSIPVTSYIRNSLYINPLKPRRARVREAAIEVHDFEMRRFATYNLILTLRFLSQGKDRSEIIQTVLTTITELQYTQKFTKDDLDQTIYFMWYIDVVFKSEFKLEYLYLFDQDFIQSTHEIVSTNKSKLFNLLFKSLHQINNITYVDSEVLYESEPIFRTSKEILSKIKELNILEDQLQIFPNLQECLKICDEIKHIAKEAIYGISDHQLQSELQHKYDELSKQISVNLESRFKFNHLIDLAFNLGAWCVFKEHFDLLT